MAAPVIVFDGGKQQYLKIEAPYSLLLSLDRFVNGMSISKNKTYARTARDEMSCYYIMKYVGAQPDPEVLAWLHELKAEREQLATYAGQMEVKHKLSTGYEHWLHNFQTSDVRFMVTAKRCINANEVGVGKTVEAIAACDEVGAKSILVVCPKSLMYMWADEFQGKSFGDVSVCTEPSSYKRLEKIKRKMSANARIFIINYASLDEKKYPEIYDREYDVVIADEAHRLKNPDAKQTENFMKLKTEYMWLLTGTPDPNGDLEEIHGMLSCLAPERFRSKWQFIERYGDVLEERWGRAERDVRRTILGIKADAKPVLHRLLMPYMLQRKKKDVYSQLPEAIYKTIPIELSAYEQRIYDDLYEQMLADLRNNNWVVAKNALDKFQKLRELLLNPILIGGRDESAKTEALLEFIENTAGQIIVFTSSKKYTRWLEEQTFNGLPFNSLRIDGDISAEDIRAREKAFQKGDAKVIYGTITKMGEGLNLQNAQAMIFMDKTYVPKDNIQAEGRILRPGLKTSPLIASLEAINTIDQMILERLSQKQKNIDDIEGFQYLVDELKQLYVR